MSRASKANKEATKAPVATPVDSIAKIETDLKQAELDRKLKAIEDEQAKAKKIADEKAEAAKREESEAHDRMVARDKAEYEQKVKAYAETYFNGDLQVAEAFVKALQNTIFEVRDLANDGDPSNDPKNEEEATGILTKRLVRHLERDAVASKWLKENNQDPEKFVTGLVDGGKRGGKYEGPANQFDFSKYASMGSGFWISSDGWILSNEHVVGDAKVVDLRLADGKMLQAKVIKVDEEKDLALLKAELAPVGWLAVSAGGKDLSLGRTVFTVGYPDPVVQGVEPKFTDGRVSAASGIGDRKDSYQTTVPVQHGNSGGALVDFDTGWVVGVVNARLESRSGVGADNVSYAIKGNVVRGFLESEPDAKAAVLKKAPTALPKGDQNAIIGRATQSAVLILKLRKEP